MIVKLIEYTPNPEKIISAAAKLCYSNANIDTLLDNLTPDKIESFLNKLTASHHESPIEHVNFTFGVEGISRSLTHQLVRHRIASYSQQSQRYVKLNQFEYVIPPEIEKNEKCKEIFNKHMRCSQLSYDVIVYNLSEQYIEQGMSKGEAEKKAIEDARYVFPNACCSKVMFTMNARTLINFFQHRCCTRAQWEIRQLAYEMLKQVKEVCPILFKYAGASCVYTGKCPEGSMTCGKVITGK